MTFSVRLPKADHTYAYDITDAAGESILPPDRAMPTFKSSPSVGATTAFRFGLMSCNKIRAYRSERKRVALLERMAETFFAEDVRFLIAAGDQVYADAAAKRISTNGLGPDHAIAAYRDIYTKGWKSEAIATIFSNFPTYMIWDDHEIDNGWGSHEDDQSPDRQAIFSAARHAYVEHQHVHNPDTIGQDLFYPFEFGDVGFFTLDLRGHRNINRKRAPLLGERQWRSFETWLERRASHLKALFVVSSVPVVHIGQFLSAIGRGISDIQDQWSAPPNDHEQSRLLDRLFDVANRHHIPVVLLGGDVHVGTVACIRSRSVAHTDEPRLYQLTSSPISNKPIARMAEALLPDFVNVGDSFSASMLRRVIERNFAIVELFPNVETGKYRINLKLYKEGLDEPILFPIG